jgi:hypothetical protein
MYIAAGIILGLLLSIVVCAVMWQRSETQL